MPKDNMSGPSFAKELDAKVAAAEKKHREIMAQGMVTRQATPEELASLRAKKAPEEFPGSAVAGIPPRALPPRKKRGRYDPETIRQVQNAVLVDGIPATEAAEQYGVDKGTVWLWIRNAKKKQREFGVDVDAEQAEEAVEPTVEAVPEAEQSLHKSELAAVDPEPPTEPAAVPAAPEKPDLIAGVEGLCTFLDIFGDTPLLSDHDCEILQNLIDRADAFAAGVKWSKKGKNDELR